MALGSIRNTPLTIEKKELHFQFSGKVTGFSTSITGYGSLIHNRKAQGELRKLSRFSHLPVNRKTDLSEK